MNAMWLSPDLAPIFLAHIFIDLNGPAGAVESVAAATFGSGDPIVLAGLDAVVIGLEASALRLWKVWPL
jgi:hypothetical protein